MKKLTSFIISLALILLFTDPAYTANADGNTTIQSFSKAKKILLRQVYRDHKTTFYCDCPFNSKKKSSLQIITPQRKKGKGLIGWNGSTLSLPMHSVKASRNGEMVILNVKLVKGNHSKGEIVPEKWPSHSGIWNPIYITWCRQSER